jgi:MYXO-CTERM domain-containing protein
MKLKTTSLAALAAFTIAGPASATTLFLDNFNTALTGEGVFNTPAALTADQSGTAATKTYTTSLGGGWDGAYQRGNGGAWLMYAGAGGFGSTNMAGSLNYDIAAAANTLSAALEISFNMTVSGPIGGDTSLWTSFTIGGINPFVNDASVGFSSLFRDSGETQQFSNGAEIGATATFTDGQLITFVLSDATGSGSAFSVSNGANDMAKMYVNGSLVQTFTGLNLDATDQFISFNANQTIAHIDNLSVTAIPEPGAVLLGGLGVLALLRRRRA